LSENTVPSYGDFSVSKVARVEGQRVAENGQGVVAVERRHGVQRYIHQDQPAWMDSELLKAQRQRSLIFGPLHDWAEKEGHFRGDVEVWDGHYWQGS
jgi:hypothetical protein